MAGSGGSATARFGQINLYIKRAGHAPPYTRARIRARWLSRAKAAAAAALL